MTDEQHNRYVAFAFLCHGAFHLLMLVFSIVVLWSLFPGSDPLRPPPPEGFLGIIAFVSVVQLVFTAPSLIAAYAILKRKSWARTASFVAAVMSATSIPTGTAACIYSLWFFLGDRWKSVYGQKSERLPGESRKIAYGVESQRAAYEEEETREPTFNPYEPPDWR